MANTMTLISSVTVGAGGAASIDFSSIPSTYTDLLLKVSSRASDNTSAFEMRLNGSSASSYSWKRLYGDGTSAASGSGSAVTTLQGILGINPSVSTSNSFGNVEIYIPNYAGSNNKSVSADALYDNNATLAYAEIYAGLWANTAAINQITLGYMSGNFAQYTTAYLYGIKNT